ncbi:TNPO1 protein, partial [Furnarius figulus]|nr:TNPO1 protein [Furnarius figulus]
GILITTIASKGELQNWPELLPKLCSLLDSEDYNTCEGAFGALQKICEDSAEILDSDVLDRPLNIMIPKFLQFFKHSSPKIRWLREVILPFIFQVRPHLNDRTRGSSGQNLIIPSNHQKTPFSCESYQALAQVVQRDHNHNILKKNILTYCSEQIRKPQSSCPGFLFAEYLGISKYKAILKMWFSNFAWLIPVLVNGMKYSEIDIILLKGDVEEDEAIPDSEQDIRPRFHRSKTVAQQHEEDGIEDDDDDDDELDDDDTISDWNL